MSDQDSSDLFELADQASPLHPTDSSAMCHGKRLSALGRSGTCPTAEYQ